MVSLKRILVATDFSEYAAWAELRAAMLCEATQLRKLEVVSVEPPSALSDVAIARNHSVTTADAAVEHFGKKMMPLCVDLERSFAIRCEPVVRFGRPVAEIITQAEEVAADLLIVGARGRSHEIGAPVGDQIKQLMRMLTRPLLIVFGQPVTSYCHVLVLVNDQDAAKRAALIAIQVAPHAHFTFLRPYDLLTWHSSSHGDYLSKEAELARIQLNRFTSGLGRLPQSMLRITSPGPLQIAAKEYVEKYKPDLVVFDAESRDCVEDLYREMQMITPKSKQRAASVSMDCLAA